MRPKTECILMKVFFDSSAFAKRYVKERGSDEVEKICLTASSIALAVICIPEIVSAFCRYKRELLLSKQQYELLKMTVLNETRDILLINLTASVIKQAVELLENNTLRSSDALHIACALEWKADLFVSSDKEQILAARKEGIKTRYIPFQGCRLGFTKRRGGNTYPQPKKIL